jgi:hypothetical protein
MYYPSPIHDPEYNTVIEYDFNEITPIALFTKIDWSSLTVDIQDYSFVEKKFTFYTNINAMLRELWTTMEFSKYARELPATMMVNSIRKKEQFLQARDRLSSTSRKIFDYIYDREGNFFKDFVVRMDQFRLTPNYFMTDDYKNYVNMCKYALEALPKEMFGITNFMYKGWMSPLSIPPVDISVGGYNLTDVGLYNINGTFDTSEITQIEYRDFVEAFRLKDETVLLSSSNLVEGWFNFIVNNSPVNKSSLVQENMMLGKGQGAKIVIYADLHQDYTYSMCYTGLEQYPVSIIFPFETSYIVMRPSGKRIDFSSDEVDDEHPILNAVNVYRTDVDPDRDRASILDLEKVYNAYNTNVIGNGIPETSKIYKGENSIDMEEDTIDMLKINYGDDLEKRTDDDLYEFVMTGKLGLLSTYTHQREYPISKISYIKRN